MPRGARYLSISFNQSKKAEEHDQHRIPLWRELKRVVQITPHTAWHHRRPLQTFTCTEILTHFHSKNQGQLCDPQLQNYNYPTLPRTQRICFGGSKNWLGMGAMWHAHALAPMATCGDHSIQR